LPHFFIFCELVGCLKLECYIWLFLRTLGFCWGSTCFCIGNICCLSDIRHLVLDTTTPKATITAVCCQNFNYWFACSDVIYPFFISVFSILGERLTICFSCVCACAHLYICVCVSMYAIQLHYTWVCSAVLLDFTLL
jgi:hypothetical protein